MTLKSKALLIVCILFSGCTQLDPQAPFIEYSKISDQKAFASIHEALAAITPSELGSSVQETVTLTPSGPIINIDDYKTSFALYRTDPLARNSYQITHAAVCEHCKGRLKQLIKPVIKVFDLKGHEISSIKGNSGISFDLLTEQSIYIFVGADNSSLRQNSRYFHPGAYSNGTINLPVVVQPLPFGSIWFFLESIE